MTTSCPVTPTPTCLTCAAFRRAIPEGKPGLTAREAATVLEDVLTGENGLLTAYAARVLTTHGWTELPNPYLNDSPRYAPPGA